MKVLGGGQFVSAMLLAVAAGQAQGGPADARPKIPVEQFVAERCGACHGPAGQGPNPIFPKLAGQRAEYLFREMQKFRSGERKGTMMQVYLDDLEDRHLATLAMYLGAQRRIPDSGDGMPPNEDGRLLYTEGSAGRGLPACVTCHGGDADRHRHASGAPAIPRLTGQHAAYLSDQMGRFVDGTRLPGQAPLHPVAGRLEDDEIRSLSRYLSRID